MTPPVVLLEPDDFAGFHALVIVDAPPDDAVLHVTDSHARAGDAARAARRWLEQYAQAARRFFLEPVLVPQEPNPCGTSSSCPF